MARSARFHISCVANLLDEIRYAPRERKRQHMEAAERLLGEIEGRRTYPEDFVIFRITGYRPDIDEPTMVVGEALLRDLGVLIERLSGMIELTTDECSPRRVLSIEGVMDRLGVSRSTIYRYRKIGLVAHQIVDFEGKKRLSYFEDAVDSFKDRHEERITGAQAHDHLDENRREELLQQAFHYHRDLGLTPRETVVRLAKESGRTSESVRLLIKRHDKRNPEDAIFHNRLDMDERARKVILRAFDFGVPMRLLAAKYGRSRPALYRVIHQERLRRLCSFVLPFVNLPTFQLDDAEEVLLGGDTVTEGFSGGPAFAGTVDAWAAAVKSATAEVDHDVEMIWFGARHFLLYEVERLRGLINRNHPSAGETDSCETRLRWAMRLKERIIRAHLPDILATMEINLHQDFPSSPIHLLRRIHHLALLSAARSVDRFDPARGQEFSSLLRLDLDRAIARSGLLPEREEEGRLIARRKAGGGGSAAELDDLYPHVDCWQRVLDLPPGRVAHARKVLDDDAFTVLELRLGLGDERPMSCTRVGARLRIKPERVAAVEYRARRRLR